MARKDTPTRGRQGQVTKLSGEEWNDYILNGYLPDEVIELFTKPGPAGRAPIGYLSDTIKGSGVIIRPGDLNEFEFLGSFLATISDTSDIFDT